jgi:hypothetical protein
MPALNSMVYIWSFRLIKVVEETDLEEAVAEKEKSGEEIRSIIKGPLGVRSKAFA